jgi:hypothetical protein
MNSHSQTDPPTSPTPEPAIGAYLQMQAGELDRRWTAARRAALRTVVPEYPLDAPEGELLAAATAADPAAVLRRVFDNSHTLGLGFRRFHRVDLTLPDLSQLLPFLSPPCTQGSFHRDAAARESRTDRLPCASPRCSYWREALHGLTSGLATAVYYSRVESPEGGSTRCVDLLHVELQNEARYQPIPESMQAPLVEAAEKMGRIAPGATVEYLGLMEGALHLQLHQPGPACGLDLNHSLVRTIERLIPGLVVYDASPRAVLDTH